MLNISLERERERENKKITIPSALCSSSLQSSPGTTKTKQREPRPWGFVRLVLTDLRWGSGINQMQQNESTFQNTSFLALMISYHGINWILESDETIWTHKPEKCWIKHADYQENKTLTGSFQYQATLSSPNYLLHYLWDVYMFMFVNGCLLSLLLLSARYQERKPQWKFNLKEIISLHLPGFTQSLSSSFST